MSGPTPKPALKFPPQDRSHVTSYLPSAFLQQVKRSTPFLTLTFATSLDSSLSLAPGTQTILSGPETKAMTHYLRSQHDAILVGVGTAVADDPALNCRIEDVGLEGQPRPIILDPKARWEVMNVEGQLAECVRLAKAGIGKGPWVLTSNEKPNPNWEELLREAGGRYIPIPPITTQSPNRSEFSWSDIIELLAAMGIKSVMVEGGAHVINTLLLEKCLHLIDSVIITIAPVWLGQGGVVVSPPRNPDGEGRPQAAARLKDVKWQQFGQDVVMCGRMRSSKDEIEPAKEK